MNTSTNRKKPIQELKRICDELKKMPREFTSIDLSGTNFASTGKETRKGLAEFAKLAQLVLNDCNIETLSELPPLPQLRSLSLIGNAITDKEIPHLRKYPKLSKLYLSQNQIARLDVFSELAGLRDLKHLELENNPVYYQDEYHQTAFKRIPQLISLDGFNQQHDIYVEPEDFDVEDEVLEQEEGSGEEDEDEYEEYNEYQKQYMRERQPTYRHTPPPAKNNLRTRR